jgi:hypothetical protein
LRPGDIVLMDNLAAHTVDGIATAFGSLLDQFAASECERYIQHSGYARSG